MDPVFEWTLLAQKALLPVGQRPKTWPKWGLPRAGGREVDLESMHQSCLYAGDLLGRMSHLEDRLKRVIERAGELHSWFRMPAAIIPPVLLWWLEKGSFLTEFEPDCIF